MVTNTRGREPWSSTTTNLSSVPNARALAKAGYGIVVTSEGVESQKSVTSWRGPGGTHAGVPVSDTR
jgi:hypothetical protein